MKFEIDKNINFILYINILFLFDLVCYKLMIEYKVVIIRIIELFIVVLFDLYDFFLGDGILVIFMNKLFIKYFVLIIEGYCLGFDYKS